MIEGAGVHVQMLRSSNQSDVKPPVFSSQAIVILIYRPTEGMKVLSRPCLARYLNPGPVAWKRDALPLSHWASQGVYVSEKKFGGP
ncbi:hypothetical protein TNCV_1976151 [Trichonephila clavipes]|nr:hypothetical protein TNCV_1976151 [Trichonephila clavipes]